MPEIRVIHMRNAPRDWRDNPRYAYIGRGSKWGNDYSHQLWSKAAHRVETREEAIAMFERHQLPGLLPDILELEGKILVCYCYPEACHGHVLVKALDESKKENTT